MIDQKNLDINLYDYPLPDSRIASHPLPQRDNCLLLLRDRNGDLSTHRFTELPVLLPPGAMLVYNNTKVINARLHFRKGADGSGALIEVFCLEPTSPSDYVMSFAAENHCEWKCFVGNSKRWKNEPLKRTVEFDDGRRVTLTAERVSREGNHSVVRFSWNDEGKASVSFAELIDAAGELPIPPYLNRETEQSDLTDYQTVFSHISGSVAAPTAGLHFTPALLEQIDAAGMVRRELTLHVGAGTFQPVKTDSVAEHEMHREFISVSRDLIAELALCERPVVAVGTTSVRTLESLYHMGCRAAAGLDPTTVSQWEAYDQSHDVLSTAEALTALEKWLDEHRLIHLVASTQIIICPGYRYRVVNAMVTNFHQPRSTLLLLVSAFVGEEWRRIYDYALAGGYRFLSYGDACLLYPTPSLTAFANVD